MTILFIIATIVAIACQLLDWNNTRLDIKALGLANEKNPIIRFMFARSPWLALAYKLAPIVALVIAALHFGDLKYWGVQYVNAPVGQVDRWAIGWILGQFGIAAFGLFGFLTSKKGK
jgi:hypothetical protein